jgi:hypothetical protein
MIERIEFSLEFGFDTSFTGGGLLMVFLKDRPL